MSAQAAAVSAPMAIPAKPIRRTLQRRREGDVANVLTHSTLKSSISIPARTSRSEIKLAGSGSVLTPADTPWCRNEVETELFPADGSSAKQIGR